MHLRSVYSLRSQPVVVVKTTKNRLCDQRASLGGRPVSCESATRAKFCDSIDTSMGASFVMVPDEGSRRMPQIVFGDENEVAIRIFSDCEP